jgi:hypothetical protein
MKLFLALFAFIAISSASFAEDIVPPVDTVAPKKEQATSQEPEAADSPDSPTTDNSAVNDTKDDKKKKVEDTTPPELTDADYEWRPKQVAKLQVLNKITSKTSEVSAKVGTSTKFENLELEVTKCMRGPEDDRTENIVLLKVWDAIAGQTRKEAFHGWMFSSSPAISAVEHPIYDVILLSCADK